MIEPVHNGPRQTGRCLCRAVRFEARGAPRFVSACHCETCRRAHSAPVVVWAGFSDADITFSGATPAIYASSPGVERLFCPQCGAQLAYRGARWAGETHIPVCAFDAPESFTPASDFYADEKLPWSALLAAVAH